MKQILTILLILMFYGCGNSAITSTEHTDEFEHTHTHDEFEHTHDAYSDSTHIHDYSYDHTHDYSDEHSHGGSCYVTDSGTKYCYSTYTEIECEVLSFSDGYRWVETTCEELCNAFSDDPCEIDEPMP